MKHLLYSCLLLSMCNVCWALGASYEGAPTRGLSNTTSRVNQFTAPHSDPGDQQRAWEQEEEALEQTDEQRNEQIKQQEMKQEEEQEKQEEFIDSHRFDEPSSRTYNEN